MSTKLGKRELELLEKLQSLTAKGEYPCGMPFKGVHQVGSIPQVKAAEKLASRGLIRIIEQGTWEAGSIGARGAVNGRWAKVELIEISPSIVMADQDYIQIAIDYHGMAVRDNSRAELIAIGKAIDNGNE